MMNELLKHEPDLIERYNEIKNEEESAAEISKIIDELNSRVK